MHEDCRRGNCSFCPFSASLKCAPTMSQGQDLQLMRKKSRDWIHTIKNRVKGRHVRDIQIKTAMRLVSLLVGSLLKAKTKKKKKHPLLHHEEWENFGLGLGVRETEFSSSFSINLKCGPEQGNRTCQLSRPMSSPEEDWIIHETGWFPSSLGCHEHPRFSHDSNTHSKEYHCICAQREELTEHTPPAFFPSDHILVGSSAIVRLPIR